MVLHYKCPNCGADMAYDSITGMLSCDSCGHNENIETYKEKSETGNSTTNTKTNTNTNEYHCKNCGAVLITDADTTATTCSFCGAGIVIADRLSGSLTPAKVIPFQINKEQAQEAFKKWCRKGLLTPKGFMNADRIKSITGIYVPFWLYDLNSRVVAEAACTKVRSFSEGDYIVTETRHYNVYRDVDLNYLRVPVDASDKMNDQLMDKLEPYHYDKLLDFKTPYLAGYIAEKYNSDDNELLPRVTKRVDSFADSFVRSTINGYATTSFVREDIDTRKDQSYYTLFPVWMVCYDYKQSEHTFAMNGQTGKIVGNPPLSYVKILVWFLGVSGVSFLIIRLIVIMLGGGF